MHRSVRRNVVFPLLAALALTATAVAQSTPPAAAAKSDATPAETPRPKRERAISNNVASALAASMPKYNPPPKPRPEDQDVDLRDVDKPRNGIIRLPRYTVRERKPPVFRERDIHTNAGFAELARRRYLTPTYRLLNSVYIPFLTASPTQHALAMYAEDERLANMADIEDDAQTIQRVDRDKAAYLRRVSNDTYMRSSGFGYNPNGLDRTE
jgi:hypothetical protein